MALVAVQTDRQVQRDEVNKTDQLLDRIAKGLSIASNIYGIKTQSEQSDLRKIQLEQLKRQEAGIFTEAETQKAGLIPVEEGTSGAREIQVQQGNQIYKGYFKPSSEIALERKGIAEKQKEDVRLGERQEEQEYKIGKEVIDFQKEKKTKDLAEKYNAATRVEALINLKNPIADAIAKRNLFRISGDVGVIRAEDLRELGADPSLIQRAQLAMDTMLKGEPITDKARIDIKEATSVLKAVAAKETERFAKQRSQGIAGLFRGFNADDVLSRMNPTQTFITKDEVNDLINSTMREQRGGISSTGIPGETAATAQEPFDLNTYLQQNRQQQVNAPLLPGR